MWGLRIPFKVSARASCEASSFSTTVPNTTKYNTLTGPASPLASLEANCEKFFRITSTLLASERSSKLSTILQTPVLKVWGEIFSVSSMPSMSLSLSDLSRFANEFDLLSTELNSVMLVTDVMLLRSRSAGLLRNANLRTRSSYFFSISFIV